MVTRWEFFMLIKQIMMYEWHNLYSLLWSYKAVINDLKNSLNVNNCTFFITIETKQF
jgi:hypothetical protein